jgi:diguanylate cyclase
MTDLILPTIGLVTFSLAIISMSIAIGGFWYAINNYRMMSITPEYVSEYIFKAVNEPIFILGEDFFVKNYNEASLRITAYNYNELEEKTIATLINGKNFNINTVMKEELSIRH